MSTKLSSLFVGSLSVYTLYLIIERDWFNIIVLLLSAIAGFIIAKLYF